MTFLNLSFLICTMGIKDLLHRAVVRMREVGAQDQGQSLVYHSAFRIHPESNHFPSPPLQWQRAEHHPLPPTPQWSILYTAATVILLTIKSRHITCLLKTSNGFHLTWSKSQGHHSSLKVPQDQPLHLSLSLLFSPILPPSNHTPLLAVPQTCRLQSCLRTFACAVSVAGMLFP